MTQAVGGSRAGRDAMRSQRPREDEGGVRTGDVILRNSERTDVRVSMLVR